MNDIWQYLFHVRADVTLGIGLILAIGVTIHILLNKRQVASSGAWIALVWFAPVLGAILYVVLGVNRVQRRARKLRPQDRSGDVVDSDPAAAIDGHLAPLARSLGRITGRPLLEATIARIYHNGDEAYPAMLAAIGSAKRSVALSSYIFDDDVWGGRFIQALIDANRRGVAVRVLIDGIGGGWLFPRAYRRLQEAGVAAAQFMHSLLPWRMPFINLRSHKKILVIDGMTGFTGGINIADQNVTAMRSKAPVKDVHFRIEGPVVCQLGEAFAQDWEFETDEDLEGDAWSPDIPPGGHALARVLELRT